MSTSEKVEIRSEVRYMELRANTLMRAVSAAILIAAITQVVLCQQNTVDSLDQRMTINNHFDIKEILEWVTHKTKIGIGFEALPDERWPNGSSILRINVRNGTVRDVLNAIVKEDPRYDWEVIDGVINVFPKEKRDSILDTKIPTFNVPDTNKREISYSILKLPEVEAKLKSRGGIEPPMLQETFDSPGSMPRFSVYLTDLTVREILNELLRMGHTLLWTVTYYGERNKYIQVGLY